MKKILFLMVAFATFAFAADGATASGFSDVVASYALLGACLAVGFAALGGAVGMGNIASSAIAGTARNPGIGSKLTTTMYVAIALVEAQVIYALVVVFIVLSKTGFVG